MNFKKILIVMYSVGFLAVCSSNVFADDQSAVILRALINAGVITQEDIDKAAAEIKQEHKTVEAAVPETIKERVAVLEEKVSRVPKWIETMKFKGDLRLRNELKTRPQGEDNNRQRLRFRFGAVAQVNDQTEVGFGLATGSSDSPLSTNQTLEREFQSKNVWIDYAYAKYKANETFTFLGGKFKRPFFDMSMLWDPDVRMDGFAILAKHKLFEGGDLPETEGFATAGYFPLDDASAGSADLYMTAEQLGIESKFSDIAKLKTGVIFYNIHGAEGYLVSDLAESKGTNTTEVFGGTRLANDFQIVNPTVKLTFNDPVGLEIPVTVFYEYAENVGAQPDDNNQAWSSGFQVNKGGSNKGDWKLFAKYFRLESDSFLDSFPDGDLNDGGTNSKGWHVKTSYALMKNTTFGFNYVNSKAVTGPELNDQVFQGDIIFKF